jgi:hypothetical protein
MSDYNTITRAQDAFQEMMDDLQQTMDAQTEIIEEQDAKIQELERLPIKSMLAIFVLAYIYGAFFGVWVCPK